MLNAQQSEAAKAESGFSLILAGAGTGKTTTLVEKVGAVIRSGIVLPAQIMLLTFSRAAAEEMKTRIAKKLPEAESITAGTFHSVALSILRRFCPEWSLLRNFSGTPSVIDEDKQNGILFDLAKDRLDDFFGIPVGTIVWLCTPINRRKGSSFHGFSLIEEALDGLLADYERFKSEHALADFSDLIRDCCLLIRESPSVRAQLHASYRYIFIDEFQDIADETLEFVRLLLPESSANLCAVGDDAQAIYSFMGSTPKHICAFTDVFPGAVVRRLTENYRSRREIIALSNAVIERNVTGMKKRLHAARGKGGAVRFHSTPDAVEEFSIIKRICDESEGTVSVLFRNNWQIARARICLEKMDFCFRDGIIFQTIHASKGLEYDTVILAGVEDGIFPGICSEIEEERRLLYVALTRAKDRLHIVYRADWESRASFADECIAAQSNALKRRAGLYLDRAAARGSSIRKRLGL